MVEKLSLFEAERLERLVIIEDEAESIFGDEWKAKIWLERRNLALRGGTPLSMLDTEIGAGEVRKILASIAHGGVV